jgi:hypothetical protein
MHIRSLAPLGLGAALAIGIVAGLSTEATAQLKQTCHMKGIWNGITTDVFEFDAAYTFNKGEDDFTGVYVNPGISQANIIGSARGGIWNIVLSYVDPAHKGWVKKLTGKGAQDPATHGILVTGGFQQYAPGSSVPATGPNATGTFTIDGKCK